MNIEKNKKFTLRKFFKYFLLSLLLFVAVFTVYFFQAVKIKPPEIADTSSLKIQVEERSKNFYGIKNNRLRKSESGLWELYIEGDAFERGVFNGKLTKELIKKQEDAFVEEIKKMIPSEGFLKFLKYLTAWFNRNIDQYVPLEYLEEIYGISHSAPVEYIYIGANYERILNYHAAHDIGHALQNLTKVGCTSFSCRNSETFDGNLIIGRNFDFYVGDKFAEDKIVTFYKPEKGYKFVEITWGGFIGTVSGMNDQGLTVTLNAAKSKIPFSSADPISLIAREILQYASNIEEAYTIAKKRKAFVAEAIMIGSAIDNATAIIEITPQKCKLYIPDQDNVIGPNHFQSDELKITETNKQNIKESSSNYRFQRISELLKRYDKIDYLTAANILRDKKGLNDKEIGKGNEKNICQLISHHSVIFKPKDLKIWVSTNPYQLGRYVCYDLDSVFKKFPGMNINQEIYEEEYTIPADSFLYSEDYKTFVRFKELTKKIELTIKNESILKEEDTDINEFIRCNPEYYYGYMLAGDYYLSTKNYIKALQYFKLALKKEIPTIPERIEIEKKLNDIKIPE